VESASFAFATIVKFPDCFNRRRSANRSAHEDLPLLRPQDAHDMTKNVDIITK